MNEVPSFQAFPAQPLTATVIDSMWHGSSGRALAEGWRREAGETDEIDVDKFVLQGDGYAKRVLARLSLRLSCRAINAAALRSIETFGSEVLLSVKGFGLNPDILAHVHSLGSKLVIFYPDYHFDHPLLAMKLIEEADLVCTTKSFQMPFLEKLRGAGRTTLVHHGFSENVHRPRLTEVTEDSFLCDIFYAGNYDRTKFDWLLAVAEAFPNLRIMIAGNGWGKPARSTALERHIYGAPIIGDYLARAHQLARINLAIQSKRHEPTGWRDLVSTRTFEIPASRGFMLHEDNAEVRSFFEVGQEFDVFGTPAELCAKIAFYLGRPEERVLMSEAGYRRAVPAYGYQRRAKEIADAVIGMGRRR
jgi:spore maturation protein CgeB